MLTSIRKKFIALDEELRNFDELGCHEDNFNQAMRCVAIARTNIETACQYAIKSLCLIGEVKE